MPRGFHGIETIFSDVRVRQKKSDVGRPSVDIDRRAEGVEFHPVRASAAGRTGFPGIDSLLPLAGMVAPWVESLDQRCLVSAEALGFGLFDD